jgi:4-alpha-glucanotransferase
VSEATLQQVAELAGLLTRWIDYRGEQQDVDPAILRAILATLDLPCETPAQTRNSFELLHGEKITSAPPLSIVEADQPLRLLLGHGGATGSNRVAYRIVFEDGSHRDGTALHGEDGYVQLEPIGRPGYHRVETAGAVFRVAVTPPRCFGFPDVAGERRLWGLSAQLYALRRAGDGGIGDFSGLAQFARAAARHGADAVAVSPVHAQFSADVGHFSPYSPSSRLFLNVLHADPAAVLGEAAVDRAIAAAGLGEARRQLENLPLVEWQRAARAKLDLARRLFDHFDALPQPLREDFSRYCSEGGEALRDHARFESLQQHFFSGPAKRWNWRDWPTPYQDHGSAEVAAFAATHASEVRFHCFLQWLADRGLRDAQAAARDAGMAVGLIGDLAVGTDAGGSHGWSRRDDMLIGLGVGAPPDLLNALGQNWGLTAFSPRALRSHGYEPFLEMLRAQLRHVGGLRIDHVLGFGRLWLVPDGAKPTEGAYLHYPIEDMFRLVALESWRHRAVIIGEDMGTVPEGFRDKLGAAGILGMRVLWFERDWGLFVEPARWPDYAVAMTTTHDLPTVAGWWRGRDIDWRAQLDLFGPHSSEAQQRAERIEDRSKLWAAFAYAGTTQGADEPPADEAARVVDAAAAFIGRTPSPLALLPAEDALGLVEQPNIPGTVDEHPNWRRRLPGSADTLLDAPDVGARLAGLNRARRGPR